MAPSQPQPNTSSPHTAHTAGPSTASSSTTSPTGTHSTVATTATNVPTKQRSWDEDKYLNLYILDYCRRRKFDETALAFEREAHIQPGTKPKFDAPQGLLFEWWIVFWETFQSQIAQLGQPGQNESGQIYVNTMARLKKLAMHEKEEQNRGRAMSMNNPAMSTPGMVGMSTPAMGNMPNPAMGPGMNGSQGTMSAMSTPAMANMPNPTMGGPRPQSQPGGRPQQPGMPGQPPQQPGGQPGMPPMQGGQPGPQQPMNGPQQPGMPQGQRPQPGMLPMHMTPNMTHATPTPHSHVSSTPSPAPTTPQSFPPSFNPGSSQNQFSGPGAGQPPFPGPGGPGQPGQFQSGPGNQQQFPGRPGQNGPPQGGPFPPNSGPGPSFPPNSNPNNGPQQQFQPGQPSFPPGSQPPSFGPGSAGFQPGSGPGPGPGPAPGGAGFQPGSGPGPGPGGAFRGPGMPEWAQRVPPMNQPGAPQQGDQARRNEPGWEDGRPRPGPGGPGGLGPKMMPGQGPMHPPGMDRPGGPGGPGGPGPMQRFLQGQPGPGGPMMNGPPMGPGMGQNMGPMGGQNMGPMGQQMGGPQNMGQNMGPQGNMPQNMRPGPPMGAHGPGQMSQPSPKEPPRSVTPQTGWNGDPMRGQGPSGMQRPFNPAGGQKRPGSPPPPQPTNSAGSPDTKRQRQDPGPGALVDSRTGPDGRPTSKGSMFPGPPGMPGQNHPGMMNGQPQNPQQQRIQEYSKDVRSGILSKGVQPPPFGKGVQSNGFPAGSGPGRGSRPPDAPSPAAGEGQPGQPRQVMTVKGAPGSMGPPQSPSLTHRNVGVVKKSESAGSSPALAPSTVPNGMGDRSLTPSGQPHQMKGAPPSPMNVPMTRPQSAQPVQQGPSQSPIPGPPPSAPPMLPPSQSPSNGMMFNNKPPNFGAGFGAPGGEFDFAPDLDFTQLTSEFFPGDMEQILNMGSLNEWPDDDTGLPGTTN